MDESDEALLVIIDSFLAVMYEYLLAWREDDVRLRMPRDS